MTDEKLVLRYDFEDGTHVEIDLPDGFENDPTISLPKAGWVQDDGNLHLSSDDTAQRDLFDLIPVHEIKANVDIGKTINKLKDKVARTAKAVANGKKGKRKPETKTQLIRALFEAVISDGVCENKSQFYKWIKTGVKDCDSVVEYELEDVLDRSGDQLLRRINQAWLSKHPNPRSDDWLLEIEIDGETHRYTDQQMRQALKKY